jgi:hypothetical protein
MALLWLGPVYQILPKEILSDPLGPKGRRDLQAATDSWEGGLLSPALRKKIDMNSRLATAIDKGPSRQDFSVDDIGLMPVRNNKWDVLIYPLSGLLLGSYMLLYLKML